MTFNYEKKSLKIYDDKGKLFFHVNLIPSFNDLSAAAMRTDLEEDIKYLGNEDCRQLWRFAKSLTKLAYKWKIVVRRTPTEEMIDDNTIGIGELEE